MSETPADRDRRPSPVLDLSAPIVELTAALCDIESVSGNEGVLADAVHAALAPAQHLEVSRHGDAVVARTRQRAGVDASRVVIAGHLDTVPVASNLPTWRQDGYLYGRGAVDMKGGVAVALKAAAMVEKPAMDVTYIWYDQEEVAASRNGLGRLAREVPELLAGDFAVLMEPTDGLVEAGCQGTVRVVITVTGKAAHSARSWLGSNAIHSAGELIERLRAYRPRSVEIDGLTYREGLNAVGISGGIANNIIPDQCQIVVNYRFAPDLSVSDAIDHVKSVVAPLEMVVVDESPAAAPGLAQPTVASFVETFGGIGGGKVRAKYGWTDVARFAELGIPAVNYGPGDPGLAHADDERVSFTQLQECEHKIIDWLTNGVNSN